MKNSSRLLAEIERKRNLLEQRMIAVRGFLQDAAVEFEPGQFAIDEALRRAREFVWMRTDVADLVHYRDRGGRRTSARLSFIDGNRFGCLDALAPFRINLHVTFLCPDAPNLPFYFDIRMIRLGSFISHRCGLAVLDKAYRRFGAAHSRRA